MHDSDEQEEEITFNATPRDGTDYVKNPHKNWIEVLNIKIITVNHII